MKEAEGKVIILKEWFSVTINYDIDCDQNIGLLHVLLSTNPIQPIDIVDSWLMTQDMVEQCEDIVWLAENGVTEDFKKYGDGDD